MTLFNYKCKDCGKEVEVEKYCTYFKCDQCEEKQKQKRLKEKSTNICTNCGKEFKKDPSSRAYHCSECKDKIQFNKTHTICSRCKQTLHRDKFPAGNTTICFDCKRKENEEKQEIKLSQKIYNRHCKTCGKDVETTERHEPQKRIGESLKHADQYLPDFDLYIEIDGLRRKDDIDWCGKLSLYKRLHLKYKIVESIKVHFNDDPEKCFADLDEKLSFLQKDVE